MSSLTYLYNSEKKQILKNKYFVFTLIKGKIFSAWTQVFVQGDKGKEAILLYLSKYITT